MSAHYCNACGRYRDDTELTHHQVDRGFEIGEPPGEVFTHVWLCVDQDLDCERRGASLLTTGDPSAGMLPDPP